MEILQLILEELHEKQLFYNWRKKEIHNFVGWSQDLPDAYWLLASSPISKMQTLAEIPTL